MSVRHVLFFIFVCFVLGVSVTLLAVAGQDAPVVLVVCESGSDSRETDDPYEVTTYAVCNLGDVSGAPIKVRIID